MDEAFWIGFCDSTCCSTVLGPVLVLVLVVQMVMPVRLDNNKPLTISLQHVHVHVCAWISR
jgi:hypothetical protein